MSKDSYITKALDWVKSKSVSTVKAKAEGYEEPKVFTNATTQATVQADISYETQGGAKHYTDIALKTDDTRSLVTRWKLLSIRASLKKGKLHLLAPKGHKMFTQKLVERHNINALIHSI